MVSGIEHVLNVDSTVPHYTEEVLKPNNYILKTPLQLGLRSNQLNSVSWNNNNNKKKHGEGCTFAIRGAWILLSRALYEKKELYGCTEAVTKMLIS